MEIGGSARRSPYAHVDGRKGALASIGKRGVGGRLLVRRNYTQKFVQMRNMQCGPRMAPNISCVVVERSVSPVRVPETTAGGRSGRRAQWGWKKGNGWVGLVVLSCA